MTICLATQRCNPAFIPLALLYLKAYLVEQKGSVQLLCREPGVTFAGIVDDWIVWEPGRPAVESRSDRVQRFLSQFCERRRIPLDFYRAFASLEFQ